MWDHHQLAEAFEVVVVVVVVLTMPFPFPFYQSQHYPSSSLVRFER